MKKKIIFAASVAIACLLSASASYAQENLRSGYFLDGYTYKYKFNPAFQGERGFFAIPVIGHLGVGVESNLALSTFLYPTSNGGLTTFLSPSVSDSDFMGRLDDRNKLDLNLNTSIIALGFRKGKSYHTIDMSIRADVGTNLPKDLFRFMKVGAADGNTFYDISNVGLRADSRFELAYGYSRTICENISVGARVKMLVGLVSGEIRMDNMQMSMAGDKWSLKTNGSMALSGLADYIYATTVSEEEMPETEEDMANEIMNIVSKPDIGAALDLGVSVDFLEYFTASASVLDLGFISKKNYGYYRTPAGSWEFDGFTGIGSEESASVEEQLEAIGEELTDMFRFTKSPDAGNMKNSLGMTVHVGIEGRMPFYDRLSVGILGTRRFQGAYSWTEGRVALNLAPLKFLSMTANYAISDFGHSFGGALNIHLPGFVLYVGTDSFTPLFNVTPQFIPIENWNTNVAFGINIAFGKYHGRFK